MTSPSLPTGLAVIFDLDGTLVDTAPDLAAAMNHVLVRTGRKTLPLRRVRNMVGHGARALLARGFAETGTPASEAMLDALTHEYLNYYMANIAARSRAFTDVELVLRRLHEDGAHLAVLTNKPERAAIKLLQLLDIARYFRAIVGGDTLAVKKPEPEALHNTIRRMGATPSSAVMVGDSETDIQTARAAGVPVIAVSYGYTPRPVGHFNPDAVIDRFGDLETALFRLLAPAPHAGLTGRGTSAH